MEVKTKPLTLKQVMKLRLRPIRTCMYLNYCDICNTDIVAGNRYYDGGRGRRAHVACLDDAVSEIVRIVGEVRP
ncbi:MAG: hypothetical protein V1790_17740 [Planctomycetota bacterium]